MVSAGKLSARSRNYHSTVLRKAAVRQVSSQDAYIAAHDLIAGNDVRSLGSKSAVIQTLSYGLRLTYADESTEVYLFDRGRAQLSGGEVTLTLDPVYLEVVTINDENPMLIQITPTADCNGLFVSEVTSTAFTVKELNGGSTAATFNWEVSARRRGYEDVRLEAYE